MSLAAQFDLLKTATVEPRSQQELCIEALRRDGHTLEAIWLNYIARGGSAEFIEFDGYFHGGLVMPHFERRVLDQTLWELHNFAD